MLFVLPGPVRVSVGGVQSTSSMTYDYQVLIQPPGITSVAPLLGPAAGDSVVDLVGTGFAGDATVWFLERRVDLTVTGNRSECLWRGTPGMKCNDTAIRCVRCSLLCSFNCLV